MTRFLFHEDAYLTEFSAVVTQEIERNGRIGVALSQSAFYYPSGGQPCDMGWLDGQRVEEVVLHEGQVYHLVEKPIGVGKEVCGQIDWPRRYDHMCQHAGEHLLAWAFFDRLGGTTIGLHTSPDECTIDVDLHGAALVLPLETKNEIEQLVMRKIQENHPIHCWFPAEEEFSQIPLRKPPTVQEHIRVVQMGDFEAVACAGTHPKRTGEIGLVKILYAHPNRGKLRVHFVCAMRALRCFEQASQSLDEAGVLLSASWQTLPLKVQEALKRQREIEYAYESFQIKTLLEKKEALLQSARLCAEGHVVFACFDETNEKALIELARALAGEQDVAAFIFSKGKENIRAVFACDEGVCVHLGQTLRECFALFGGKGGGKANFASGSLPLATDMRTVRAALLEHFS